ncbi:MAG TPA: hypothetical protein VFG63_01700 [Nocardioidaceae bacterium]|nr:hypothetical protein [Nocardioidaceae bacterium]
MPPPRKSQPEETSPPWWPASLEGAVRSAQKLREQWQYVVVEEVVGGIVELMRWPWPSADRYGRLIWEDDANNRVMSAVAPQRLMRLQLYRPNNLERRPRAGDTFGARLTADAGWGTDTPVADLAAIFPAAVYDISADAREAAKLAYQGASAAVFNGDDAEGLLDAARRQRLKRPKAKRLRVAPLDEVIDDEDDLA